MLISLSVLDISGCLLYLEEAWTFCVLILDVKKNICLLSSQNSLWGDKHKKVVLFFPDHFLQLHLVDTFLIFNDILEEDYNPISSLMPPSYA